MPGHLERILALCMVIKGSIKELNQVGNYNLALFVYNLADKKPKSYQMMKLKA